MRGPTAELKSRDAERLLAELPELYALCPREHLPGRVLAIAHRRRGYRSVRRQGDRPACEDPSDNGAQASARSGHAVRLEVGERLVARENDNRAPTLLLEFQPGDLAPGYRRISRDRFTRVRERPGVQR